MSIDALSLKYRPKKLSDVIGQPVVTQTLINSWNDKNWHHAYLLEGNLGCGKSSVSRIMAAMDNCEKGPTLEPCGVCKNCTDIFAAKSIDVCELNTADNRGIDDIRELKSKSYLSPVNSRVKYFILNEIQGLTGAAAESALMFIEEPPNNVRILLTTTDPQKIKDTIISRCIRLSFNKISWMDLQKHLQNVCSLEKIECDENASAFIAKTAKGSVRDALQNLQNVSSFVGKNKIKLEDAQKVLGFADQQLYFDLIDNIVKVDCMSSTLTIEKIILQGKNIGNVIETLSEHLRNLLLARTCSTNIVEFGILEDEAKKYIHQASNIVPSVIAQMLAELMDVQRAIILNLNPQHYLEKWVIQAIIQVVKSQKK
jgi:DNA polymerase-3 subunit gamma/tau